MPYIGKQPTKIPLTSDDIADGAISSADIADLDATKLTGTVNNARISLDAAELPNLDTAKVTTGTFADARISAGSVTQHVTATDLTPVRQDIAMLALFNAVSDNRAAYNLPFSFVDQFEDDTGLTTQTDVDRVGDYIASVYASGGTPAYVTGDRQSSITVTHSGMSFTVGVPTLTLVSGGTTTNATHAFYFSTHTPSSAYIRFQFSGAKKLITEAKYYADGTQTWGVWKWQGSDNASDWTDIGSSFTLGGATPFSTQTSMSANAVSYTYYQMTWISGELSSQNWHTEIEFKQADEATVASATGTLISDTQTAPTATTKMSGVILYKDNGSGASTLGTHLKIYLSANNGSNWTEVPSYGAVTPLFSTGVKMVRIGETTVT